MPLNHMFSVAYLLFQVVMVAFTVMMVAFSAKGGYDHRYRLRALLQDDARSRCGCYAAIFTESIDWCVDATLFTLACFYVISATSRNSLKPDGTDHTLRH
jgi:hypothetical protein